MGYRIPAPDGKKDHEGRPLLVIPDATIIKNGYILNFYTVGGMSVAYRGEKGGVTFFVKEVEANDERRVASLEQEYSLLERLTHPYIPKAHDLFEYDGFIYLVQDFVEGQGLDKLISHRPDVFIQEKILMEWASQLYDLFEYLHRQEPPIIYRDLKPSNIIRDTALHLHLVDFGIARVFQEGKGRDTEILGSAMTASPEHYGRSQTDVRSDIFTLGATLHFLATNGGGRSGVPFEFEKVRKINPALSEHFEQILGKALEMDPAKRFQSIDEMRCAHLNREPLSGEGPVRKSSTADITGSSKKGSESAKSMEPLKSTEPPGRHRRKTLFIAGVVITAIAAALIIALLIIPGFLAAKKTVTSPSGGKTIKIAALFHSRNDPGFEKTEDALRATADKMNAQVIIIDEERFRGKQAKEAFKTLRSMGVSVFMITPDTPGKNLMEHDIPLIAEANKSNIPVIFIHNTIEDAVMKKHNLKNFTVITCDDQKGGRIGAAYIAERLKGKGTVLILEGDCGAHAAVERRKGYREEFGKYGGIKTILAPDAHFQRKQAFDICKEIFKARKDIDAVFAFSDEMATGAYDAAMLPGNRRPVILGFGATARGIRAVDEGKIDGTVDQSPAETGRIGIECALKAMNGEKVPGHLFTSTRLIDRSNLPVKLNVAINIRYENDQYPIDKLTREFEKENPGIEVRLHFTRREAQNRYIISHKETESNEPLDVACVDSIWIAELASRHILLPLNGLISRESLNDIHPQVKELLTYRGKLSAMPFRTHFQLLFYNSKMLRDAGFNNPPKTIEEWENQMETMKTAGIVKYPLIDALSQAECIVCEFVWLTGAYGGSLFDRKGQPVFNKGAGLEALKTLVRWVKKEYINPSSMASLPENTESTFLNGNAAFTTDWLTQINVIYDPEFSRVCKEAKVALIPVSEKIYRAGSINSSSVSGYQGLGIIRSTRHPREAWNYIQKLTSPESSKNFPDNYSSWKSVQESKEMKTADSLWDLKKLEFGCLYNRPVTTDYEKISQILQKYLKLALEEKKTPQQALDQALQEINKTRSPF